MICDVHKTPLIVTKNKDRNCCPPTNTSTCNKFSYYKFPEDGCSASLCKRCFKTCNKDNVTRIKIKEVINEGESELEEVDNLSEDSNSVVSDDSINFDEDNIDNEFVFSGIHEEQQENRLFPDFITP